MRRSKLRFLAASLAGLALLAGCREDDADIRELVGPQAGGDLFDRYVAVGNSITAGYVSGGISAASQAQAYPVLIARQANTVFQYPVLAGRGCTPPLRGPFLFDTVRVGPGSTSQTCDLLANPTPTLVQNLAVPGAAIGDAIENLRPGSASNVLTTLFLGGRTQAQAMVAAKPTLVSVYLGNNDLLGGAVAGDTTRMTPAATFAARLDSLVTAIRQTPAGSGGPGHDVVLIGIAPFPAIAQPGAYFFAQFSADPVGFRNRTGKTVNLNCAPGSPFAASLVSFQILAVAAIREINCAGTGGADFVLTPPEVQSFYARAAAYNTALRAAATANGWIYVDTNEVLAGAGTTVANLRQRLDPQRFRLCQGLATATTPAQIQVAVATTCPAPTPPTAAYTPGSAAYANFFGSWMTFDAVHPDVEFQTALANAIIAQLNAKHTLSIPPVA